jgi:hypothetical protein
MPLNNISNPRREITTQPC